MRICLYTTTLLPKIGGQELAVHALSEELARQGHAVTVLSPTPRRPLVADDARQSYRVVRHPRFVSTRWFVPFYGRFLRSLAASNGGFDVVNTHDAYPTGWLAVRNRAAIGAPVVITSHGGDLNEGNVRIVKPGVLDRCAEAIAGADALVSIGRFTEANFQRVAREAKLRLPLTTPMTTIPNGVHLEEFSGGAAAASSAAAAAGAAGGAGKSEKPAGAGHGPFVLFMGRLHRRKGVDVLLRAVHRRRDLRLLIAGAGEEAASLEALAGELGLIESQQVKFLGSVVGPGKNWLLRNARAVLIPSRGWEGCPLVALETAAAGRPVIASCIPGVEDLVADGQTGRLVPEGHDAALASAIGELWDDPAKADAWGAAAAIRVQRYAWPRIAREYVQMYQEAIARVQSVRRNKCC
jgi:phosphatidylinositol alpha-mannosyltransferase